MRKRGRQIRLSGGESNAKSAFDTHPRHFCFAAKRLSFAFIQLNPKESAAKTANSAHQKSLPSAFFGERGFVSGSAPKFVAKEIFSLAISPYLWYNNSVKYIFQEGIKQ